MKDLSTTRFAIGFLCRAVIGTALVLGAITITRRLLIKKALRPTSALLQADRADAVIARLKPARHWAHAYPPLLRKLDFQLVHAYLKLKDYEAAEQYAHAMTDTGNHSSPPPESPWESLLVYPNRIANAILASQSAQLNPNAGMALVREKKDAVRNSLPSPYSHDAAEAQASQQAESVGESDTMALTHAESPTNPVSESIATASTNTLTTQAPIEETPTVPSEPSAPLPPGWGVTITSETRVYSTKGERISNAPVGTLIKVYEQKSSPGGNIVVCSIVLNGHRIPRALIRANEVALYNGPLANTTTEERKLRILHARILAHITSRKAALEAAANPRNPHTETYAEARDAYEHYRTGSQELRHDYEHATGAQRMHLGDKLRLLKHEGIQITEQYETAKANYAEWEAANPVRNTEPNFDQDPNLMRLRKQLNIVEQRIATL